MKYIGSIGDIGYGALDRIPAYLSLTGGTITYSCNYKIHTFTSGGTLSVPLGGLIKYLVVGAGGHGGSNGRGGGGGGQVLTGALNIVPASYTITVGQPKAAWVDNNSPAGTAQQSVFSGYTANGGNDGGDPLGGTEYADGGGFLASVGGNGTNGVAVYIPSSTVYYGGGGGGACDSPNTPGAGGLGGGGSGGTTAVQATAGASNTGGGGGGGRSLTYTGKQGGSGIVIIWYQYK